jgi:hypothetical protein
MCVWAVDPEYTYFFEFRISSGKLVVDVAGEIFEA